MVISGFDYQMYQDEIAELREEMTQLLLSMEYKHQTMSRTQFQQWWEGEGHLRRYYECKGRIEQIESPALQNEEGRSHRAALWSR